MPNDTRNEPEDWAKRAVMVLIFLVIALIILIFAIVFKYLWHWYISI